MLMRRNGSGSRTFLGIHGWGGGLDSFAPLVPCLPEDVRFLSVALPGVEGSSPPVSWTLDAVTDRLVEVLDGIEGPVTLVGYCSGAIFGLLAAQRRPTQIEHIVLFDPFAYIPWYMRLLLSRPFGPLFYYSSFGNPLGRFLTNRSLRGKDTEQVHMTEGFAHLDHAVTYRYLRLLDEVGSYRQFADLACPMTILYGAHSFRAIHRSVEMWCSVWPQAEAISLSSGGHLLLHEALDEVVTALFPEGVCMSGGFQSRPTHQTKAMLAKASTLG